MPSLGVSISDFDICDGPGCLLKPLPGQKFCRTCLSRQPEIILKAHRLLMEEVRRARSVAAREVLQVAEMARIYAVQAGDAVKFGRTAGKLEKRINSLQTGSPVDLKLVCWILAPSTYETGIHHFLKRDAHMRGEWFKLNHPDTEMVLDAIASGKPKVLRKIIYGSSIAAP